MKASSPKHKKLVIIVGPTAVGKTSFSINMAEHLGTEIISADSRQVFRELNIGTAKPSVSELARVNHHFISIKGIEEEYNAGKFEVEALNTIRHLFKRYDHLILTGGSGLYVRAVCEGFDHMPEIPDRVRKLFNHKLEREGLASMSDELEEKDPAYYALVDKNNPQRVLRALEVIEATGRPYSSFRQGKQKKRPFQMIKIGLELPREVLYERIEQRMDQMIQDGLFEEARGLYPFRAKNALQTVGYQEIFDHIDGKYDWEQTVSLLKRNSRRYAKRQFTWFKKDKTIQWIHPEEPDKALRVANSQDTESF